MTTARMSAKGQITIPKEAREKLHLKPGDELELVPQESGSLLVVPTKVDVMDLYGMLPKPKRPLTLEEMEAGIRKGATRT